MRLMDTERNMEDIWPAVNSVPPFETVCMKMRELSIRGSEAYRSADPRPVQRIRRREVIMRGPALPASSTVMTICPSRLPGR